jgi:ABC-type uncharacterized transport system permease subunit
MKVILLIYICSAALLCGAVIIGLNGMDTSRIDVSDAISACMIALLSFFLLMSPERA